MKLLTNFVRVLLAAAAIAVLVCAVCARLAPKEKTRYITIYEGEPI